MNYPGFTNEELAVVVAYTISSYPEDARRRFRAIYQKEAPRTTLIGWQSVSKPRYLSPKLQGLLTIQKNGSPTTSEKRLLKPLVMIQHFHNERQLSSATSHNRRWTECWRVKDWGLGRGGPIQWPPRSPDLAVNDFWLWGYIRDKLYRDPRPRSLPALQERLTSLLDDVEVEMIRSSYKSFLRRCELCSENRGGHFEQFLWFISVLTYYLPLTIFVIKLSFLHLK